MTEDHLQRQVAALLDATKLTWCHVANEHRGDSKRGNIAKARGQKKGVSDVLIFNRPGLAIELKVPRVYGTGRIVRPKPSKEQQAWLEAMVACGWYACVCYSLDEVLVEVRRVYGWFIYGGDNGGRGNGIIPAQRGVL